MKNLLIFSFVATTFLANAQSSVTAPACIEPFYHGVASGDPLSDRVIIWTRVTPDNFQQPALVSYKVATDTSMTNVVSQGSKLTDASKDYTVKIDVTGLSPDTYYFYEFRYNGQFSQRGRTRTAPVGDVDSLRFAVVSCANLEAGYFNAYRILNQRNDFDAVLMLGDYIYEYETGGYSPNENVDRTWQPANEILTLDDYRMRYSIYHMDEALRKLHQNFPWICVWDDHETANDSYKDGAENHNAGEGDWQTRKLAGQQAYFEWLPIREKEEGNNEVIFRTFKYGDLIDLVMVDTRLHGRDEQVNATSGALTDPGRSMLGTEQMDWLKDELSNSTAKWKVLGNQVVMAKVTVFGTPINTDAWDGYPITRQAVYDHILGNGIQNFAVLTGDIHTSWAFDLKSGSNKVGVEFVTPSITSPGSPINAGAVLQIENAHLKYVELTKHGFIMLNVTKDQLQADWYYIETIDNISNNYNWAKSYYTNDGAMQLVETSTASVGSADRYDFTLAPDCPRSQFTEVAEIEGPKVIALYPNPVGDDLMFHFVTAGNSDMTAEIYDMTGRVVMKFVLPKFYPGFSVTVNHLPAAQYNLRIVDGLGRSSTVPFIKK
ncbi:MAG: alkaline phosphatase D family protein [Bacteroidota bacterium]